MQLSPRKRRPKGGSRADHALCVIGCLLFVVVVPACYVLPGVILPPDEVPHLSRQADPRDAPEKARLPKPAARRGALRGAPPAERHVLSDGRNGTAPRPRDVVGAAPRRDVFARPWAPLGDVHDVLNVQSGAWIMHKRSFPKMLLTESEESFNKRFVNAIIDQLAKAWPPRVIRGFAQSFFEVVFSATPAPGAGASPERDPPKVAFLFLVGGDVATEPLWRSFFATDFASRRASVYVHPPRGYLFPEGSFFEDKAVPQDDRYEVTWASLAMVHAELVLIAHALKDPRNERFVLLSETDVPLWPFPCMYGTLFSSSLSYMETKETQERFAMYEFRNGTGPLLEHWRKGSQWFALTREHAAAVAHDSEIRRWYKAFARAQLQRRKVDGKGLWGKVTHVMNKPSFTDEHYVQTTLAKAGVEDQVLPVSLTFATFGRKHEYTVWGNGGERPFRLDDAQWHAVQFGALSLEAMDKMHELCAYDVGRVGPGDDDAQAPAARPARTKAGPYDPAKLQCSVVGAGPVSGKYAPCFLFGRKIHAEAVFYYAELSAEFFLERERPGLRAPFSRARVAQRRDAAQETAHSLTGKGIAPAGDYATAHMQAVLAALPAETRDALYAARDKAAGH